MTPNSFGGNIRRRLFEHWRYLSKIGAAGILCLLLLLGLALRVQRLDFQPLWWDEGYSVWFATDPIGEMLALTSQDIHPPLYYALLHAWIALLGPAPPTLRLFSVYVSLPAIALIYVAARRLLPRARPRRASPALVAAILVACNPFHLYYSQEIRMYGLVISLALLYLILAAPWLAPVASPSTVISGRRLAALTLATAALAYTQYYAVLLPLGAVLIVLNRQIRRRAPNSAASGPGLRSFGAAHLAAALLYLPWGVYAAPRLTAYVAYKVTQDADVPLALPDYIARHLSAFLIGHAAPAGLSVFSLLALLCLAGLLLLRWRRARRISTLVWLLIAALACGFLLNLRFPFAPVAGERLLSALAPAFWLWLAALIAAPAPPSQSDQSSRLPRAVLQVGLTLLTALALIHFFLTPRYPNDDYRPLIAEMAALGSAADVAFCIYPWQVGYLRSYLPNGPQALLSPSAAWTDSINNSLHEIIQQKQSVWFPAHLSLGGILETQVENSLMQQGFPVLNQWISPSTRLTLFAPPANPGQAAAGARFGDWLTLIAGQVGREPVAAGAAALPISLTWRLSRPTPAGGVWQVRLRLTDRQGVTWAQRDSAPANGLRPFDQWPLDQPGEDRHGLWIPAGTPPGHYELTAQVYQQAGGRTERPLDILDAQGRAQGVEWRLAQVQVTRPPAPLEPDRLQVSHPVNQRLGSELRWLGFDLAAGPWQPGDDLALRLAWQVLQPPAQEWRAFVQLLDGRDAAAAAWEGPPLPDLPASQWQSGDLLTTPLSLRLPAGLTDGHYRLITGLFEPISGQRLAPAGQREDYLTVATVEIKNRPRQWQAPAPAVAQIAQFGGQARLLGYDLAPTQARAGDAVHLALVWQAGEPWARRGRVFVHLLAADGQTAAQADSEPGEGSLPTTGWLSGEFLTDRHVLHVPDTLPPGAYEIEIGFYFDDSTRLPLLGADGVAVADRFVLNTRLVIN